jgi:ketosteroid isomerase-like protein
MSTVTDDLIRLKNEALAATQRADGDFYAGYLADDAVAITPYGVFDKAAVVAQMGSTSSSFKSESVDDVRAVELSPTSGVVSYRANYAARGDAPATSVYVTTVYRRDADGWKGVVYQQTPVRAAGK